MDFHYSIILWTQAVHTLSVNIKFMPLDCMCPVYVDFRKKIREIDQPSDFLSSDECN